MRGPTRCRPAAGAGFALLLGALVTVPLQAADLVSFGSAMRYQVVTSSQEVVLVQDGSAMRYLANLADPGIGLSWTAFGFDDTAWGSGSYGVGYEVNQTGGARGLIRTQVPIGTYSVYTRASFTVADPTAVSGLSLGADYDDGYIAWINGVEVYRSPEVGFATPAWNTNAASHESSNGSSPNYGTLRDLGGQALAALRVGTNVLAIGIWNNNAATGSDLVLVPRLALHLAATGGTGWTAPGFDDSGWPSGTYGVGYETGGAGGAQALIQTAVPAGSYSVYTRARFTLQDAAAVTSLFLGADYDDGYIAWINGVEVYRSPEMPAGDPQWNTDAALHESSNGVAPDYGPLRDITTAALPHLVSGENLLAVGVWNGGAPASSDLVLVPLLTTGGTVNLTRGPYLQSGTDDGVVVRWRTSAPSGSRVRYGLDPADLAMTEDDAVQTTEHVVSVSGLEPATTYYYAIGSSDEILAGGDGAHRFVTSPRPGTAIPTRVWAIGDSGTANASARAVRDAYTALAAGRQTDVWLMLGDNAYPSGTDSEYQAALFNMFPDLLRSTVVWPTLGNHDGATADSATQSGPYYDIFTLPRAGEAGGRPSGTEAYYSFDYGNIHFICLESHETNRSPGGAMLTWLRDDLLETRQDWIIAFWHHPPYSKGSHDSDVEIELVQMRQNALPILEQGGVDLVLAGHSHSYERSFLLDGHYGTSSTLTPGMILDGGDGRIGGTGAYQKPLLGTDPHEGAVYVVAGSSGQTSGGPLNHPAMFLSLNLLGSLVLDIDGQRLDARFIDSGGVVRDGFTLVKGPLQPPVADFTANPLRGVAPLAVQFTDLSSGSPTGWSWDFEADGRPDSDLSDPLHVYGAAGLFSVSLEVSGAGGTDTALRSGYICATSADGSADADADGISDGADLCPCDPDPAQVDTDGDGAGDVCDADDDNDGVADVDDCAPRSIAISAPPGPIGATLQVTGGSPAALAWSRGRAGPTSNLYRGLLASGSPGRNDTCRIAESPAPEATDADDSPPGTAFYYLVTARNLCGESAAGADSQGAPRLPLQPCATLNRESDGDGLLDLEDNCPLDSNVDQVDFDADTLGDSCDPDDDNDGVADEDDCAPLDPALTELPAAVGALGVGPEDDAIGWSALPQGQLANLYRGSLGGGAGFVYDQACLQPGVAGSTALDAALPLPGAGFYYLVSASNGCGEGSLGADSTGASRPNRSPCP